MRGKNTLFSAAVILLVLNSPVFAYQQVIDLGTLGGLFRYALGINASGQVVGYSFTTGNAARHAFICSGSTMTDLGTLGGTNSCALGINASGQVAGWSYTTAADHAHAFLYSGSTMTDLGTLGGANSAAWGINASGQVVGISDGKAFLYSGSTMTDLNTLIDPASGWTLAYATGINDAGQICGYGTINGQTHAFLLNTPEPATVLLFGLGISLLRRKK